jgi:hypothetical protein
VQLLAWFDKFAAGCDTYPEMNSEAARLLGRMAATPALQHFFITSERRNKHGDVLAPLRVQLGGDVILAAMSITHRIPIATLNTRDFIYIDRFFPLPGVYDPRTDCWLVTPSADWFHVQHANDDETQRRPFGRLVV